MYVVPACAPAGHCRVVRCRNVTCTCLYWQHPPGTAGCVVMLVGPACTDSTQRALQDGEVQDVWECTHSTHRALQDGEVQECKLNLLVLKHPQGIAGTGKTVRCRCLGNWMESASSARTLSTECKLMISWNHALVQCVYALVQYVYVLIINLVITLESPCFCAVCVLVDHWSRYHSGVTRKEEGTCIHMTLNQIAFSNPVANLGHMISSN